MALFEQPAWVTERQAEIEKIIAQYPDSKSALMPLLHLAQEVRGYVADEDIAAVAEILNLTHAYVESVCSFYSMYHRHPVGKYHLLVCNNCSCAIMGGETTREHLKKKLGIDNHQTTPDGLISLEITHECLANCDAGPVLTVNGEYVVRLTNEKIDALVDDLRAGKGPDAHIEKRLQTGIFWDADPNDIPKAPANLPEAPVPAAGGEAGPESSGQAVGNGKEGGEK